MLGRPGGIAPEKSGHRASPTHAISARAGPDPNGHGRRGPATGPRPCRDTANRCSPLSTEEARRALAEGVPGCPQCRPHVALGVLE
ncbi:DUF6233 domain-containing protein [Streptomyces sp. NPDC006670]|uniref:DUF6233 domain-containing protein n=1 Tax=Streptomyces sp. NPDC006670 TaxID=3154476 RepID=UPI00340DE99F